MDKKVLVSDYDQTFYLNDEDIEKNKIAVNKFRKKGNIFIIATGRSYYDFHNKLSLYKFDYDYLIINHGATILDKDGNIFANFSINNEIIDELKIDLQIEKSVKGFCCSKLDSRVDFNHLNLTKINIGYSKKEEAITINELLNNKYQKYINSYKINENSLEIISSATNKSKAINLLLNELDISNNKVYTIGDGYSDVAMIKEFNGYAMKNAVKELKEVAIKEYESVSELINEII